MRSIISYLIVLTLPICLMGQNDQIPSFGALGQSFQFTGLVPSEDGFIGIAHGRERDDEKLENDVLLYQISNDGEILDSTVIKKIDIQEVRTVTLFDDGFFIVGGMSDHPSTGEEEAYLMGFENDGTLAWELIYPGIKEDRILRAGKVSETEAVFLVGYETNNYDFEKALIKVSKTGELIWDIAPNLMLPYDRITSIRGDNDGNVLIMGVNNEIGFLRSYDEDGNFNWELSEIEVEGGYLDALFDLVFDESQDHYVGVGTRIGTDTQSFVRISKTGEVLSSNVGPALNSPLLPGHIYAAPHRIIASPNGDDHFFVADNSQISEWTLPYDLSEVESISSVVNLEDITFIHKGFEMYIDDNSLIYYSRMLTLFGNYDLSSEELLYNNSIGIIDFANEDQIWAHSVNDDGLMYLYYPTSRIFEWNPNNEELGQELNASTFSFKMRWGDIAVLDNDKIAIAYFETTEGDPIKYDLFDENGILMNTISIDGFNYSLPLEAHIEPTAGGGAIAAFTNVPSQSSFPLHYILQVDENGDLINEINLSGLSLNYFKKILPTDDQHLLLLGVNYDESTFRLVKYSLEGNIVWDKSYPVPEYTNVRAYGLSISPDGDKYVFSGSITNDENGAIYWTEMDLDGNILRSGLVDEQEYLQHQNSFIHYNNMGDILIFSSAHDCIADPDSEAYYMGYWRVDDNNNVTELAKYFSAYPLVANDSEWLSDGRLSISGYERLWNEQDFFAVILDESGLVGTKQEAFISTIDFRLSPNPTTGPLQLSLNNTYQGLIQMQIGTIDGQIIHAINTEKLTQEWQYEWDTKHLPKGSYYIKVMTKEGGMSKLWVKQ